MLGRLLLQLAPHRPQEGREGRGAAAPGGDLAADQGLHVAQPRRHQLRGQLQAQHVIVFLEADPIRPGGVAQGEVAGLQHRLAPALAVEAAAGQLEVQVKGLEAARRAEGVAGAADARGRRIGAHQRDRAQGRAHHFAMEAGGVLGVDDEVVEGLAREVVPEGETRRRIRGLGRETLHRNRTHGSPACVGIAVLGRREPLAEDGRTPPRQGQDKVRLRNQRL